MDGPEGVYLHIFTEGARITLGEFAAMVAIAGEGRGLASPYDWRSRLGGILDGMPCNPVVTIKGLVGSPRMTTPDGIIGYSGAPWEILGILGGVPSGNASCSGCARRVPSRERVLCRRPGDIPRRSVKKLRFFLG